MLEYGLTLTRHIMQTQREKFPEASGTFSGVMMQIATASKVVAREVNRAGLADILGMTGESNVQGEAVRKLDEYANRVFLRTLGRSGHFAIMASEENADPIEVAPTALGDYTIAIDPLDGSSNIDVNVSIGTIFSIHKKVTAGTEGNIDDLLQPGSRQICAGYVIYGSSTMMVYTVGRGVHGFTLEPSLGEYLLSNEMIKIPARGKIYSCNEGNAAYWSPGVREYIDHIKETDPATGRPYSARYIGSMVADVHRTLLTGGIFMYPADTKSKRSQQGKLRLLYEAAPMALIMEQAGGRATDGHRRILDIEPESLHQRVPVFLGSEDNVRELEEFIAKAHRAGGRS